MNNIKYKIVSRGIIEIQYNDSKLIVSGELTFNPPVFYADLISLKQELAKYYRHENNLNEILDFFTNLNTESGETKILFD